MSKKEKSFNISVVGLSGTEKEKGSQGVGKSCLCNRFVRPREDDYNKDHISVLSQSDFGGRVVNNDHFLFWGSVAKKSDDEDIIFNIIEQTEFIDDTSFQPLRGSNTTVYFKRSTATKLSSAEKLMYIDKDQLGLENEYDQTPLPDGKINIDGFLCVFDVSNVPHRTLDQQTKFLDSLFNAMNKTKKPVVLVATKCDEAHDHYRKEAERYASSKKVHIVETSANENVNVETAFMVLAQMIDKRVRAKNVTYHDASKHQKQVIETVTENYMALLQSQVTNYHTLWNTKKKEFQKEKDYQKYVEVLGEKRAKLMYSRHIQKLREEHLTKKLLHYLNQLPKALDEILPEITEISGKDLKDCHDLIRQHPQFDKWFVMLSDGENWKESEIIHRDDETRIPFDVLTRNENEMERGFKEHVNKLNARVRKERMKIEFKKLLEKTTIIQAGKPYDDITIFLMESECFRELNDKEKKEIYDAHQRELGESAKDEFRELLFEYSEVFAKLDPSKNVQKDDLKKIHEALKRESRYTALNYLDQDREVLILRHIGFLHNPTKETCLSGENCADNLVEKCFDSNAHRPSSWNRRSSYIEANNKLNIVLLGQDGLADELANEIKAQSCEEDYTLDGNIYSLELRPLEGDVSLPQHAFRTPKFMPNACICVYNCVAALEYLNKSLHKTVLPTESAKVDFPGLPLAVIFARETSNSEAENNELRTAGQQLADRLQCVFVDIPTDTLWRGKRFHESQITQALRGIIKTIKFRSGLGNENSREYMDPDIKIQLCMMCDDPYKAELVLTPLVNHQCCWINPDKAQTIALDTFLGSEKRKVEVMAVSYHQAMTLKQDLHHGYILVYSTKRKASLAMLKAFSRAVLHVPKLILAVSDSGVILDPESQKLLSEGNALADELEVKFVTASQKFKQETAVFTPFFKEAFDKKTNTEDQVKLTRTLSMENIQNVKRPLPPPKPKGGRGSRTFDRRRPVSVAQGQDPIDMLYNTVSNTKPRKPPRGSTSRFSLRKPEPEEGWVENQVYEGIEMEKPGKEMVDNVAYEPFQAPTIGRKDVSNKPKPPPKPIIHVKGVSRKNKPSRTDSESDQSSLERPTKGDNIEVEYAQAKPSHNKKPHKNANKPSPVSNKPPPIPVRSDARLEYEDFRKPSVDTSSDSGEDNQPSHLGRQHDNKHVDDENMYDVVGVGYQDQPTRVQVLPRMPGEENGEANHEDRKNKKSKKEEKELEKQKKKEEKRLREEEKRKQKEEEKKKKKKSKGGNVSVSYTYFGSQLEEIVTDVDRVPLFVVKCVEYLEAEGLKAEGLYRVPGKNIDSDLILQKFDEDQNIDLVEMNMGINAVATALKYFFNELPDPIIPVGMQGKFLEAVGHPEEEKRMEELRNLLDDLPQPNFDVLQYMMLHLHKVTEFRELNLMNSENLSVCWWPTLLHPEFNSFEAMAQNMKMRDVIELFILQAKYFFGSYEDEHSQ